MVADYFTNRNQDDDEHWIPDVWDDDDGAGIEAEEARDGFDGYVETTVDPGRWAFLLTLAVCLFSTYMIPVMVILGRRWEERRGTTRADDDDEEGDTTHLLNDRGGENGDGRAFHDVDLNDVPPAGKEKSPGRRRSKFGMVRVFSHDDDEDQERGDDDDGVGLEAKGADGGAGTEVEAEGRGKNGAAAAGDPSDHLRNGDHDDMMPQDKPPPSRHVMFDPNLASGTHRRPGPAGSVVASTISGITNNSSLFQLNEAVARTVDRILIPAYPDDDEEFRSNVGGGGGGESRKARSTLSEAVSEASSRFHTAKESDLAGGGSDVNGRHVAILDAGLNGRRGKRHRGHYHANGRAFLPRGYVDEDDGGGVDYHRTEGDEGRHTDSGGAAAATQPVVAGEWGGDIESEMSSIRQQHAKGPRRRLTRKRSNPSIVSGRGVEQQDDSHSWIQNPVVVVDDISPNDAADADDPGRTPSFDLDDGVRLSVCCGRRAIWRPAIVAWGIDSLVDVAEYDHEMGRIFKLAVPFVFDEVLETVLDFIDVALVANFVGTDAVAAYAVAELFLDTTDEFIGGIGDAESTLCPHALGAGNNFLAAQYVQISITMFLALGVPLLIMWALIMDRAIMFLGLSANIARIGLRWTRVAVIEYVIEGTTESVVGLLEITDHERYVAMMDLVFGVLDITAMTLLVTMVEGGADLTMVAFVHLIASAAYAVVTVGVALCMGWYGQFIPGLIGSCALRNFLAVKNVMKTALPLAVGNFLAYSEWEVLTFFAARLGPAEVAVWALLGTIWEIFEASTEGLGEAAAVRVSYHLGRGNTHMARISSYKCLLVSVFFGFFVTSIFFMCGENLAIWLTNDATLQNMIAELIPLVGLGNVTMTFGMTSWHIIGAQARYRLATLIALICSWFITMPLAAISVFVLNLDLQGVVSAVVIGYSLTGSVMAYILLRSDWERISHIIRDLNALTGVVESGGSSSDDDSSKSSNSRVDSDSDDDDDSDSEESLKKSTLQKP